MLVVSDINDYFDFAAVIDLGLNVNHNELDFDKMMVFSWIRERIKDGKH